MHHGLFPPLIYRWYAKLLDHFKKSMSSSPSRKRLHIYHQHSQISSHFQDIPNHITISCYSLHLSSLVLCWYNLSDPLLHLSSLLLHHYIYLIARSSVYCVFSVVFIHKLQFTASPQLYCDLSFTSSEAISIDIPHPFRDTVIFTWLESPARALLAQYDSPTLRNHRAGI